MFTLIYHQMMTTTALVNTWIISHNHHFVCVYEEHRRFTLLATFADFSCFISMTQFFTISETFHSLVPVLFITCFIPHPCRYLSCSIQTAAEKPRKDYVSYDCTKITLHVWGTKVVPLKMSKSLSWASLSADAELMDTEGQLYSKWQSTAHTK